MCCTYHRNHRKRTPIPLKRLMGKVPVRERRTPKQSKISKMTLSNIPIRGLDCQRGRPPFKPILLCCVLQGQKPAFFRDPQVRVEDQETWTLEDLLDRQRDGWSDDLHAANSLWSDMVWPRVQGVFATFGRGSLDCSIGELQSLLLTSVFLHMGTGMSMTSCLRALMESAFTSWKEHRRANRRLIRFTNELVQRWGFKPVVTSSAEKDVVRIIKIRSDHSLMESVFSV